MTCKFETQCKPETPCKDYEDKLETIQYDGHTWEVGYFGCQNNGYSAWGFRQDGVIIRVTSEYEAKLLSRMFINNKNLEE